MRSIAKDKGLPSYYKLKKDVLVALLLEESAEEIPAPPSGSKEKKRRPLLPVKIIPGPQEKDEFEKEEIEKSKPVVKYRLNELYDWLLDYVPKLIKNAVSKAFTRAKNSILRVHDGATKTWRGDVEDEAEKEN